MTLSARLVDQPLGGPTVFFDDHCSFDLGRLLTREDYGHDRSLKYTFEHGVRYCDRAAEVSPNGSIVEPSWAGWASD